MEAPIHHISFPPTPMKDVAAATRRSDTTDVIFGMEVRDPYRWMENDTSDLDNFLLAQNVLLTNVMKGHPYRDVMRRVLERLNSRVRCFCPVRVGSKYLVTKSLGTDNPIIYIQDGINGKAKVFLDPHEVAENKKFRICGEVPSENGEILGYFITEGSGDSVLKFKNILTGESLLDTLTNIKFTNLAWTIDNVGIVYSSNARVTSTTETDYDQNISHQLVYHHLGTNQSEDIPLASFLTMYDYMTSFFSSCGKYLLIIPQQDTNNLVYFINFKKWTQDGRTSKPPMMPLIQTWEADFKYITSKDSIIYFRTNKTAPNFRLIAIDLNAPTLDEVNFSNDILPEDEKNVLELCSVAHEDFLFVSYVCDVKSTLQLHNLKDGVLLQKFSIEVGNIKEFSGSKYNYFFFKFTSFDTPGIVYRIDLKNAIVASNDEQVQSRPDKKTSSCVDCFPCRSEETHRKCKMSIFHKSGSYKPLKLIIKQEFFKSKDGTKVPMFIVYCARIKPRQRPCLMEAYGAHGYIFKPFFSALNTAFMEHMDGIIVIVNARGGGEYGKKWYDDGRLLNKQHTFDDIQSAAEHLIKEEYTSNSKLILRGSSSGGMATAVCVNQRPDLFAGAISIAGSMDMMRFHKFTLGYTWISDYGSPDNKEVAMNIFKFSPYHNISFPQTPEVKYPAILVLSGDCYDRVVPLHSYKYVAELQHVMGLSTKSKPVFLRVETDLGSEIQKTLSKEGEKNLDILTFISFAVRHAFK